MKFNFLLLFISLFIIGCGPPEFEKNTRILVKGTVVDENNNPISKANIEIFTERATGLFSSGNYLLGSGLSDVEGAFSIISLFDRDEEFQIEVYTEEQSFSKYYYLRDTNENPTTNLIYDLKTVMLNSLAQVNYNITRTSSSNTELKYSFQYQTTDCVEVFDDQGLNLVQSNCLQEVTLNGSLTENQPEISRSLTTLLGSIFKFTYSINDEPEITETYTIDKEKYEFNFSY